MSLNIFWTRKASSGFQEYWSSQISCRLPNTVESFSVELNVASTNDICAIRNYKHIIIIISRYLTSGMNKVLKTRRRRRDVVKRLLLLKADVSCRLKHSLSNDASEATVRTTWLEIIKSNNKLLKKIPTSNSSPTGSWGPSSRCKRCLQPVLLLLFPKKPKLKSSREGAKLQRRRGLKRR